MNLQKIMVVLDSRYEVQPIIAKATLLAKRYGAEVELAVYDYCNALVSSYFFDKKGCEVAIKGYLHGKQRWAESYAKSMHEAGVEVSIYTEWTKHPYKSIVERASAQSFDLIMKSTHKHSLVDRAFMTHADWHLMRETPVPLLFVRDGLWGSVIRVAAAVDPAVLPEPNEDQAEPGNEPVATTEGSSDNELNHKILAAAYDFACKIPAEFHVVHAYEPLATGMIAEFDTLISNYTEYRTAVRDKHQQALDGLLKTDVERGCIVHFEEGSAEAIIPRFIRDTCIDIVILGAVARSGVERIVIGSTAERLLDYIDSDLLVLRANSSLEMV